MPSGNFCGLEDAPNFPLPNERNTVEEDATFPTLKPLEAKTAPGVSLVPPVIVTVFWIASRRTWA